MRKSLLFAIAIVFAISLAGIFLPSAQSRGNSEKLGAMVIAFDLKGDLIKDADYLYIVSTCIVNVLASSETFDRVEYYSDKKEPGVTGPLTAPDYQRLAQERGMDVLFVVNIGREGGLRVEGYGEEQYDENPYPHHGEQKKFSYSVDAFYANIKAISLLSGKIFIYAYVRADWSRDLNFFRDIQDAIRKYTKRTAAAFPMKKGKIIEIGKNTVKTSLGAKDGLVPGGIVSLFNPDSGRDLKGGVRLFRFQPVIEEKLSEVDEDHSVIGIAGTSREAGIKKGWIVEAIVQSSAEAPEGKPKGQDLLRFPIYW